jgi:dolichyl-phosphate beta-glucosyltransferase
MQLSLVIPAYNEQDRIADTLRHTIAYLGNQSYDAEIVVVDDGSRDATSEVVQGFLSEINPQVRLVRLPGNRGKGFAVRTGMFEHAAGAFRVFYDADASTPIEDLERLWPRFSAGADIVIGSRALPDSDVQVHQAWYRETMGRIFNGILRILALTRFKDTQCGFKGFSARACEIVFPRQTVERFSFDAELLVIAAAHGLRIDEVPVHWRNRPQSRVHPVHDSARMLLDLFVIRWKELRGRYK